MSTSRWAAVVDALVSTMRATSGFRSPRAVALEAQILVLDGPEWQMAGDPGPAFLVIGGSIEDDATGDSGQVYATIGNRTRDENGSVMCNAVAQLGGVNLTDPDLISNVPQDTWKTLRATTFAIMASLEGAIRTDPTLGISNVPRMEITMGTRIVPRQYLTEHGAVVSVTFAVDYVTRI